MVAVGWTASIHEWDQCRSAVAASRAGIISCDAARPVTRNHAGQYISYNKGQTKPIGRIEWYA